MSVRTRMCAAISWYDQSFRSVMYVYLPVTGERTGPGGGMVRRAGVTRGPHNRDICDRRVA
ncbi:hypothetical protein GCM10023336_25450 [Streptomyces similanensis]|uniref:Uncharacterized protein n=1 Tax=Streptomyces similanensis TaxID=1274988 RepID=A0ABP9KAH2_9ACTN